MNDKRVAATSMPPSILFSFHPFANIGSAILKLHAIGFATREKVHDVAIDQAHLFQIENDVATISLEFKKSHELGDRLCFDSATQGKHRESASRRSLNSKSHRTGHWTNIAVAAVLHCIACIRAPIRSSATEEPIGFH
jgi:hypothetical protein